MAAVNPSVAVPASVHRRDPRGVQRRGDRAGVFRGDQRGDAGGQGGDADPGGVRDAPVVGQEIVEAFGGAPQIGRSGGRRRELFAQIAHRVAQRGQGAGQRVAHLRRRGAVLRFHDVEDQRLRVQQAVGFDEGLDLLLLLLGERGAGFAQGGDAAHGVLERLAELQRGGAGVGAHDRREVERRDRRPLERLRGHIPKTQQQALELEDFLVAVSGGPLERGRDRLDLVGAVRRGLAERPDAVLDDGDRFRLPAVRAEGAGRQAPTGGHAERAARVGGEPLVRRDERAPRAVRVALRAAHLAAEALPVLLARSDEAPDLLAVDLDLDAELHVAGHCGPPARAAILRACSGFPCSF